MEYPTESANNIPAKAPTIPNPHADNTCCFKSVNDKRTVNNGITKNENTSNIPTILTDDVTTSPNNA